MDQQNSQESLVDPRYFILDYESLQPYEVGAILLSMLASPPVHAKENDWSHMYDALCYQVIHDLASQKELERQFSSDEVKRLSNPPQRLRQILNSIDRRLDDRLVAARIAIGFFQEAETGIIPELPDDAARLSVNQMTVAVLPDTRENTPENVISRVWSPSLPIIHICAALAVELSLKQETSNSAPSTKDILFDKELVKRVIWRAEFLEDLLPQTRLKINPDNLVRLRFPLDQYPRTTDEALRTSKN